MEDRRPLTPEILTDLMADIQEKYADQPNTLVTAVDTRDYILATLKGPGYHNKAKRRRTIKNASKNLQRRVVEGRRNKTGLSHYITGKDS